MEIKKELFLRLTRYVKYFARQDGTGYRHRYARKQHGRMPMWQKSKEAYARKHNVDNLSDLLCIVTEDPLT